jgi:hypothetical protein
MGIFTPAIEDMNALKKWYRAPQSFWQYLKDNGEYLQNNGLKMPKTPMEVISVDSLSKLKKELRESNTMVLRLGRSDDKRITRFALVKSESGNIEDFFFIDEDIFKDTKPQKFETERINNLDSFSILPSLIESSYINLAVFSGLLTKALGLEEGTLSIPATAKNSQYTFNVRPRCIDSMEWEHKQGQVEIDALFTAKKNGKPSVILVESKVSKKLDSLSKHKLLYPYLALKENIEEKGLDIIMVYMRIIRKKQNMFFYIMEALFQNELAIDSLMPGNRKILYMELGNNGN